MERETREDRRTGPWWRGGFDLSKLKYEIKSFECPHCSNLCEIREVSEKGADGIVTGILNSDGTIDAERTSLLAEYAAPMKLTFHRAFDLCRDADKAMEDIVAAGASRLLTSGQARTAIEGAQLIKRLVSAAGNSLTIIPGAGIDEYNIAILAGITGAREYHLSARRQKESTMSFRRKGIYMGDPRLMSEYIIKRADMERIRTINRILRDMVF